MFKMDNMFHKFNDHHGQPEFLLFTQSGIFNKRAKGDDHGNNLVDKLHIFWKSGKTTYRGEYTLPEIVRHTIQSVHPQNINFMAYKPFYLYVPVKALWRNEKEHGMTFQYKCQTKDNRCTSKVSLIL